MPSAAAAAAAVVTAAERWRQLSLPPRFYVARADTRARRRARGTVSPGVLAIPHPVLRRETGMRAAFDAACVLEYSSAATTSAAPSTGVI